MESIILLVVLLFLILLGAPIGFILILIPFVYILFTDAVPLVLIPSQMFNAIDSVPLTAIAFFMLTGELMTSATITDRLVALSRALIGRIRGGLAQVNVLVSMFFAGMNGSVVADTATVGALVLPAMKKAGYPAFFIAGNTNAPTVAVSATTEPFMPAKNILTRTFTWAKPPRIRPINALLKATNRSVIVALVINSPVSIKNAIAVNGTESIALNI